MRPFELRGDGILLAIPTPEDIERITEICQDPESQQWTTIPVPYEREDAETFVTETVPDGWSSGRSLTWAIRDPEDRRVLGMISVRPLPEGRGEIGFNLAPDARGGRVMSRAVRLVADYAFDTEGLSLGYLHWWAYVGNWASRRVAWATGFRIEGLVRGSRSQRGVSRDSWVGTLAAGDPLKPAVPWFDVPVLHGTKVVLRRFVEADIDSITEACGDAVTQHWLSALPSPYTRAHAEGFIGTRNEESATGRGIHWAATDPGGGPAVGSFSLSDFHRLDGGAEVGYWLHPAVRGRGLAAEAVNLAITHAFTATAEGGLGLQRLVVRHADGNDASRRVIERARFRPSGVERAGHRLRDGTFVDVFWYDLLADDLT